MRKVYSTPYGDYILDPKSLIDDYIIRNGNWEGNLYEIYSQIISPEDIVLDIGANLGFHSVNFGKLSKLVYAFEPQNHICNQLRGNIYLNGLDNKVKCYELGIGETNKKTSFTSNTEQFINSHNIVNYGAYYLDDSSLNKDITIITLDSLNLSPNFIKIDVEGYELKVIQGGLKTLITYSPVIMFESLEKHSKDAITLLKLLNYQVYHIEYEDYIAIHPNSKGFINIKNAISNLTLT